MKTKAFTKVISLVLALVLMIGSIPAAMAAEQDAPDLSLPAAEEVTVEPTVETTPSDADPPPDETEPVETTVPAETEPPEPTETSPAETNPPETTLPENTGEETEPTTAPTEATEPTEPEPTVPAEIVPWELEIGDGLVPFTEMANGIAPQTLPSGTTVTITDKISWYVGETEFYWYHEDYGRMPDKNSTSSAVYFKLSDGRIGFCTQPFKSAVTGDYAPTGWYRWIDGTARRGIARILTYGAPNNGDTSEDGIKATALALWDMAAGYLYEDGSSRGHGTAPFYANTSGTIRTKYDEIMAKLKKHGVVPSFSVKLRSEITSAQTITLTYDRSSGLYKGSATDTNGVLADFNFTSSISGLTFSKSGNTLNITATDAAAKQLSAGVTIKNRGHEVEVGPDSCTILASSDYGTDRQLVIILDDPIDPVPCYFKLLAVNPTGDIEITKHTSSGTSLSGWKFEVFTDAACTNRVGTATSGTDGKTKVTGLTAGTYYVREVDESDTYPWWQYDTSVKAVTIPNGGGTATVSFTNTLLGDFVIRKHTNTGEDLAGWQFNVYSDAAMTKLVKTITTNEKGLAYSGYLTPAQYYVKEVDDGNHPGWTLAAAFNVTVYGGQDTYVDVTNVQQFGAIRLYKSSSQGLAMAGVQFRLEIFGNDSWAVWKDVVTDADGAAFFTDLPLYDSDKKPIRYRLTELQTRNGFSLMPDPVWEGTLEGKDNFEITLGIVNSPAMELPRTGGAGIMVFTVLAALFTVSGTALLIFRKRECPI